MSTIHKYSNYNIRKLIDVHFNSVNESFSNIYTNVRNIISKIKNKEDMEYYIDKLFPSHDPLVYYQLYF